MGTSNASELERRFTEIEKLSGPACRNKGNLAAVMDLARELARKAATRNDIRITSIDWEDCAGFRLRLRPDRDGDEGMWGWLKTTGRKLNPQWIDFRVNMDSGHIWSHTDNDDFGDIVRSSQIKGMVNRWLSLHDTPVADRRRPVSRPAVPGSAPRP